ncbi:MAG: hypothetical protein ACREEB_00310 [Caulobacteraceae bacterium]
MTRVLRGVLVLQAAVLMAQALLAGLALAGGGGPALGAHMAGGGVSLLLAVVQVGLVLALWRQGRGPSWLVAASLVFLAADGMQAVAGRAHLFALHLPLGVALFGAAVGLSIRSWDLARDGERPGARATVAE